MAHTNGSAILDFDMGRGFGPLGAGLPADFLSVTDPVTALTTIAAVFSHPDPTRVNTYTQAVAMLALYGAGARVTLTGAQYGELDEVVEQYESIMKAPKHGHPGNEAMAHFVRLHAAKRANLENLA